jgi:predicted nucleic acid-binding Zn ribbon protein
LSAERAGRRRERTLHHRTGPVGIGAALESVLQDLGIKKTLAQYDVLSSWPDVVGVKIARVTVAQRMEQGILYVGVTGASWRAELTMRRMEIMKKLNAHAGRPLVKDIRFR